MPDVPDVPDVSRTGVDHVLLTRFNLPSGGHESLVRAKENWLRDRVQLFERYCLPSVLSQSDQDHAWIIYFDPQSPDWLLEWVRAHEQKGHFTPILREEVPAGTLLADLREVVGPDPAPDLLTTNLDNDDSLARDFVARVKSVPRQGASTAVYIGQGLIRRGDTLYRNTDEHNAFASVRASWEAPVTCWRDWHNLLPTHMAAVVLPGAPGWLQVIHGANVSNRVRGRLARPAQHRSTFPGLLDDVPEPGVRDVLDDLLVAGPGRRLREGSRAGAKAVIARVAGRQGLDRFKSIWTSARSRIS